MWRLALGQQAVGLFDPVPAVVAVHCVVAPGNTGDPAAAEFREQRVSFLQRWAGASRGCVATVEKSVQVYPAGATPMGQANRGQYLIFMTVNATG